MNVAEIQQSPTMATPSRVVIWIFSPLGGLARKASKRPKQNVPAKHCAKRVRVLYSPYAREITLGKTKRNARHIASKPKTKKMFFNCIMVPCAVKTPPNGYFVNSIFKCSARRGSWAGSPLDFWKCFFASFSLFNWLRNSLSISVYCEWIHWASYQNRHRITGSMLAF